LTLFIFFSQMKVGEPCIQQFQASETISKKFESQRELNLKGMGPRFSGGERLRVMGRWSKPVHVRMREEGERDSSRKKLLSRK
jgi:hypothetical protein